MRHVARNVRDGYVRVGSLELRGGKTGKGEDGVLGGAVGAVLEGGEGLAGDGAGDLGGLHEVPADGYGRVALEATPMQGCSRRSTVDSVTGVAAAGSSMSASQNQTSISSARSSMIAFCLRARASLMMPGRLFLNSSFLASIW